MSDKSLSRRTAVQISVAGVDVTPDVTKYLQSVTYTDASEDETDDLKIVIDDREGIWLKKWLNSSLDSGNKSTSALSVGSSVMVKSGATDYNGGALQSWVYGYTGFKVLEISSANPDRIVIGIGSDVTAAIRAENLIVNGQVATASVAVSKGLKLSAVIAAQNFSSDGKDKILDCGTFELDDISVSGPPTKLTLKGTSLAYSSTVRTQKKSKAWQKISLKEIAAEIASKNNLDLMYISSFNPFYSRKEQIKTSDAVFLTSLAKAAGIVLKITAGAIVLYDGEEFESNATVAKISAKSADIKTYSFDTGLNDTAYSACHVSWTKNDGTTIDYTYTPNDSNGSGEILEVNEKVETREDARQLAMKRLRQKNKKETTCRFTLVGNTLLVVGVTIDVEGYGLFDGKYIINSAVHNVTGSGYTTQISASKCLEGY